MAQDIEIDLDADTPAPKKVKAAPVIELEEQISTEVATIQIEITQPNLAEAESEAVVNDDVIPNGRDHLMQLIGKAQAFSASADLLQTFGVSQLAEVKENKLYKHLAGTKTPNGLELKGTWEEFCGLIGMSDETANQRIANLRTFGEAALEGMARIGIGVRDLAQYRKLPVDQRTALIAAAESGDKNQLIDLAETLIERHAAEKAEHNVQIANLTQDLEKAGNRAKNMDAEIERLELQNERLTNKQRLTKFETHTEDVRHECMHLQAGVELHFESLEKLFYANLNGEQTAEHDLRIDQVYIAIKTALARGIHIMEQITASNGDGPDRVLGQHILTPEEAERWTLEWESLKNAHGAAEAARQIKRDADRPRGRGRPSKAQGE